jgi:hypothetical protein
MACMTLKLRERGTGGPGIKQNRDLTFWWSALQRRDTLLPVATQHKGSLMTLARHYVRIPKHLQQYATNGGAPESDWARMTLFGCNPWWFRTGFEPLPAGTGPIGIGLIGGKLYYEATIDKDREDTLYMGQAEWSAMLTAQFRNAELVCL